MPYLAILYATDDLVCHRHDGISCKPHHYASLVRILWKTRGLKGLFNDRGEILVTNVLNTRPANKARGEYPVEVGLPGLLDAVGGHDNGARECIKLLCLVLPRGSVVAVEVRILLELRISVTGKHLTVGVDVYALAFGLLEYQLKIPEVMAGNQYCLALFGAKGDLCRNWMAVVFGICRIKKLHGLKICFTCLEGKPYPIVQIHVLVQGGGKYLMDCLVVVLVLFPKDLGMVCVCAHTL